MDSGAGDVDTGAVANVESISVVATVVITVSVVNSDASHSEFTSTVDAEDLHRGVLDVDVLNIGVDHLVGVEELRLGLAAVGTFAVPPARTVSVNDGVILGSNGDLGSGDLDQGTIPLLVAEGGGA